ncbi:MAG: hypothetical protein K2P93_02755 [Alphaproteobacteria bacterium]|nr:hypothetical protein [Alphaproteobacteria bacterium]
MKKLTKLALTLSIVGCGMMTAPAWGDLLIIEKEGVKPLAEKIDNFKDFRKKYPESNFDVFVLEGKIPENLKKSDLKEKLAEGAFKEHLNDNEKHIIIVAKSDEDKQ